MFRKILGETECNLSTVIMHPRSAISGSDEIGVIVLDFKVVDRHAFRKRLRRDRLDDQRRTGTGDDGVAYRQVDRRREALARHRERMLGRRRERLDHLTRRPVRQIDPKQRLDGAHLRGDDPLELRLPSLGIAGNDPVTDADLLDGLGHERAHGSYLVHDNGILPDLCGLRDKVVCDP